MTENHTEEIVSIIKEMKHISEFETDYPLISSGFFDSFDIMTLISRLETQFGVTIPGEEITPENLDTVADVAAMVQRLKNG